MTVTDMPPAETPNGAARKPLPPLPPAEILIEGAGLGAQWAPHGALAALVLAASATRAAVNLTDADAAIALGTAGAAFVIAVVAAWVAKRKLDDSRSLRRALAFVGVAAVWLTTVTATGLSTDAFAVLALLGYGLSLHWWRTRRIPNPPPTEPAKRSVEERPEVYVQRWNNNVGAKDGALPGARLDGQEEIKAGFRYVLRLRPGRQTYAMAMGVLDRIRSGLQLQTDQDLIVEKHPTLAEPNLLLTIVTRSPIRDTVFHPCRSMLDPATGRIALGPFVDGEGLATWNLYGKNRMYGGYVQGGSGAGKSRLIDSIALSAASSESHPTVVWFADGQGNASSPMLMKRVDHGAQGGQTHGGENHGQIHDMLAGALLIMQLRQDENGLNEAEGFTPTEDRPGLLIIIDECHKPMRLAETKLAAVIQWMIATLAREGGKVGVVPLLASQSSTLDAFGPATTENNAEAIRSNLLLANGVVMRSKDNNAKTVFSISVNPKDFPPIKGYGYLVDPDDDGRQAPYRGYRLEDEMWLSWADTIRFRSLDRGSANAYGPDYLHRRDLAAVAKEVIRQRVEARRAGRPVPSMGQQLRMTIPAPGSLGSDMAFGVKPIPVWVHSDPEPKPLRDGHQKVLAAIQSGCRSPKSIEDATNYSPRHVYNLLGELVQAGRVRHVVEPGMKLGAYEPAQVAA